MSSTTSSGSRVLRRIAIFIVVLAVILVGADRLGDYFAERTAANSIQDSQHLQSRPDVDVAGFPFLTQFAARDYDKITVTADDVPIGKSPVIVRISNPDRGPLRPHRVA